MRQETFESCAIEGTYTINVAATVEKPLSRDAFPNHPRYMENDGRDGRLFIEMELGIRKDASMRDAIESVRKLLKQFGLRDEQLSDMLPRV